jgi:uncharacterized Zn finger protein
VHALAVMLQVAWLVDGDPWVLLRLRGLAPDDLQAALAATADDDPAGADDPDHLGADLASALDAAARAARVVALADDPDAEIDHLL